MKLKVGDIFTIPVNDEKTGFGQIIKIPNKSNFVIVVFNEIYAGRNWPGLTEIVNDKILFFGYTMDAKLYHKHWKIIGNDSINVSKIKMPFYKLGTPPDCKLTDYKGNILRRITKDIFDRLNYQEVIAPVRYENALKATHNFAEWREDYNELLYDNVLESIKQVEGLGNNNNLIKYLKDGLGRIWARWMRGS